MEIGYGRSGSRCKQKRKTYLFMFPRNIFFLFITRFFLENFIFFFCIFRIHVIIARNVFPSYIIFILFTVCVTWTAFGDAYFVFQIKGFYFVKTLKKYSPISFADKVDRKNKIFYNEEILMNFKMLLGSR